MLSENAGHIMQAFDVLNRRLDQTVRSRLGVLYEPANAEILLCWDKSPFYSQRLNEPIAGLKHG